VSAYMPALDPAACVQCHYEENHKICNKCVQIHLIECRKNNRVKHKTLQAYLLPSMLFQRLS